MPSAPSTCSSIASRAKSDRWSRRLGGLDGLVFTAGIGENDAATRAEVVAGLAWAGLTLDEAANGTGGPRISSGSGPIGVGHSDQRGTGDRTADAQRAGRHAGPARILNREIDVMETLKTKPEGGNGEQELG